MICSPRQSIQDADYLHRQAETVSAPELEQALLGDSQGITFEPAFSYQAGREQFRGTVEFTFAYIAREHPAEIDHELVARLVAQKFAHEGGRGRYRELGVTRAAQLPGRFTDRRRLDEVMHDRGLGDLFFALAEQRRDAEQTLTSTANIERLALGFWESTLELLRRRT